MFLSAVGAAVVVVVVVNLVGGLDLSKVTVGPGPSYGSSEGGV